MLGKAEIAAIVPVSDVERAVEFYGGTLGLELQIRRDDLPENREAEFRAGLRERGVAFEEYDLPDLKTENGIAMIGDLRASWARDPDGNIIAFEQRV
jgi:catechol 2,3-dioxygenase-like lactoylglutathione lyase family enzyme